MRTVVPTSPNCIETQGHGTLAHSTRKSPTQLCGFQKPGPGLTPLTALFPLYRKGPDGARKSSLPAHWQLMAKLGTEPITLTTYSYN